MEDFEGVLVTSLADSSVEALTNARAEALPRDLEKASGDLEVQSVPEAFLVEVVVAMAPSPAAGMATRAAEV